MKKKVSSNLIKSLIAIVIALLVPAMLGGSPYLCLIACFVTIYIIGAYRQPQYAVFQCPCGCGRIVELNLNKESSPSWALKWHVLGTISFSPSIWRKDGCRSHFFLKKVRYTGARKQSGERICG